LVALFAIVAVLVVSELNQRRTTEGLLEKAALTSRILASTAAAAVWDMDTQKGLQLLRSLEIDADFEGGIIVDDHGGRFASLHDSPGVDSIIPPPVKLPNSTADLLASDSIDRTYVLKNSIVAVHALNRPEAGNKYLGVLALSFSRTRARVAVRHERFAIVAGGVAMIGFVCGLLAVILSHVTRPIREMTIAMRRLADGEIEMKLPVMSRRDEIGAMADALSVFRGFAYRATHDSLTDLPNRALLYDRLEKAVANYQESGRPFALHLLDLDHFKAINDQLGHAAGDELLRIFSGRLRSALNSRGIVARLGGDEFCILQSTNDPHTDAPTLAERIVASMSEPVTLEGNVRVIGASIGIALASAYHPTPTDLLKSADLALYQAKRQGRCCYRVFGLHSPVGIAMQGPSSSVALIEGSAASTSSAATV